MKDRSSFLASLQPLQQRIQSAQQEWDACRVKSVNHNPWFIQAFTDTALEAILQEFIDQEKATSWLNHYSRSTTLQMKVGLIMAGNIPLVGFHDLFCVLAAGHHAVIKLSDKDPFLLPFILRQWQEIDPGISESISIVDRLEKMDAVIATGSNNSGRYFEYYFREYPHLFRQNRNGVAVLTGNESVNDLKLLATDIFMYFGLGCRNVSKIYVPEGYDFRDWSEAIAEWTFLGDHHKYKNNLDYNHAIYLINQVPHINLGHLVLKEDDAVASRIGCLHYHYYRDSNAVIEDLEARRNDIQCVVSGSKLAGWDWISFGTSQHPSLGQYADGLDTMQFLSALN